MVRPALDSFHVRSGRPLARLLIGTLLTCAASGATAQVPPPQSSQTLPPTREEVTRPESQPVERQLPQLEVEGGIERAPCALDSPEFANIRLTLRGAVFDGLKGLSPGELNPSYSQLVGTDHPISVVCDIRDRAATILRNAGYIAAVEVPQQKIADGVVHFRVLMAHLVQVRVRGDASGAERIIAGYLNQLTKQPVFNRYDAERYLLLASDLPGYNVRLTLRPTGQPGEVLGDVTVQRTPAYADLSIQNGGSHALGPWGGFVRGQFFGLTGLADRTTLAAFSTADFDEQQTIQIGHDFRIGPDGLGAGGLFTYAWAHPSIPGDSNIRARTLLATLQLDYPLIRTLGTTLRGSTGLDYVNQTVDFNGKPLSRDRLRVGFLRVNLDALSTHFSNGRSLAEPEWHLTGQLELRKGLNIFGASDPCSPAGINCVAPRIGPSRTAGLSTASLVRGFLYGEYRPVPKLTLAVGARAQYAWRPLFSFEEFSAGNYTVGRGYDPGALLGDRGWGTQAEVRVGTRIPKAANKAAVEGYAFWDHARVSNLGRLLDIDQSRHLDSMGGGARVTFDRFTLDGALAVPLTRIGAPGQKPPVRFLISLTTRLWPWSYQ